MSLRVLAAAILVSVASGKANRPNSIRFYEDQQELAQIRERIARRAYLHDINGAAEEDVDDEDENDTEKSVDNEEEAAKLRAEVAALKKELSEGKKKKKKNTDPEAPPEETRVAAAQESFSPKKKASKKDLPAPYFGGQIATLTPFGREDVGRELTERSIFESDRMVDQIEKAEVAEEKRAVYRALTRLRGAAINSFDGVAHSQVGNIDEYAATNRFREQHPVKHLAKEESNIKAWAFPEPPTNEDNAYGYAFLEEEPEVTLPEKDGDKAFKSSADACQACYFFAHGSESMKEYCTCYSANTAAFGATSGGFKMQTTDQDNWRWTCSPTPVIGDNYAPCTQASGRLYEDQYGDATN